MLYKDWLNDWLELYVKVPTKTRTYLKYRRQVEKYILPAFGGREIDSISATELQKFSLSLIESDLAANTICGIISVLKCSLKKAVALGIADRQFTDSIVRPRPREKKVECFDKSEQKKIEKFIFGCKQDKLFGIVISLYTGLRIGELLALKWEDVDFTRGVIYISKSCRDGWENGRYKKILDAPKTRSSERVIPVPRQLIFYLKELKKRSTCPFVVAGRTQQGAQIRSYQKTFELLLNRLGIAHKGFHALRHTFATRALEVGMDIKTLSEIMGHRNAAITLQRYAHSLIEHKMDMMNKVGRLLI